MSTGDVNINRRTMIGRPYNPKKPRMVDPGLLDWIRLTILYGSVLT